MKINKELFQQQYQSLTGKPYSKQLPDTFNDLLDAQYDPDEFAYGFEALLLTCQSLVAQETGLHTEFMEIYKPAASHISSIFLGHVKVQGDFYADSHTYILGNLEVSGVIYGNIHCILAVAGNITCSGMYLCRSYFFTTGSITIKQCFLGITYGFAMIRGTMTTPVYIQDRSWINCDVTEHPTDKEPTLEKISAQHIIETDQLTAEELQTLLVALFGTELVIIDQNGDWDFEHLFTCISKQALK
ncbi:MAG TPA: hypothetical protein VIM79_03140 [Niastella sp.]